VETQAETTRAIRVMPYCRIIGQENLRSALEISYVSPLVGGVLASGQRGTAKSTAVRAFARMVSGELPVTLPIGATDDRVLGGWRIDKLMEESKPEWRTGLIQEASEGSGMLYVDEVNLLDDHLVNIILDVASTGILTIERDDHPDRVPVRFTLVGTMNPEEGSLRPQLLDRFGLMVEITSADEPGMRAAIIKGVLDFEEEELRDPESPALAADYDRDREHRARLEKARAGVKDVEVPDKAVECAAALASAFQVEGHRSELVMVRAARALAAIEHATEVRPEHLAGVARLALVHRRGTDESGTMRPWSERDDERVAGHIPPTW